MKFERRLHNGKWAAYVRVLGIWWFIRDFNNAKKAGYFVSIAMGQNILRPRKEKKVPPPPAAPAYLSLTIIFQNAPAYTLHKSSAQKHRRT